MSHPFTFGFAAEDEEDREDVDICQENTWTSRDEEQPLLNKDVHVPVVPQLHSLADLVSSCQTGCSESPLLAHSQ